MKNLLIFDLDGVITSEEAYWNTAGLALHELLYSPNYWNIQNTCDAYVPAATLEESEHVARQTLPLAVIVDLKARSINSNWDICYAGACLCLIELVASLPDYSSLLPLQPTATEWIAAFRQQLACAKGKLEISAEVFRKFDAPIFRECVGLELLNQLNTYASERLLYPVENVFSRYSPSWWFCQNLFQEWYLGEELYTRISGNAPVQLGKPGCIYFEQPLLPIEQMQATFEALHQQGYTLGVATGRSREEGIVPLKNYGLFQYFDERYTSTHTEIALAEAELHARGEATSLVKPHPYQFLLAADPTYQLPPPEKPTPQCGSFIVVGDSTSDILGGRAAGALTVAVLTGARTAEARVLLEQSRPDFIIEDVTQLPTLLAHIDSLATIQHLQFTEREKAEMLLQRWFVRHMNLPTESVTLTPKPISLNSFNGFYRTDGEEYFFKTHVEEQGILEEYYHTELLYKTGYNVVRPLRTLHEQGRQMVIYPVVHLPIMFDLMRAVETDNIMMIDTLAAAEKRECERLLTIYRATLAPSTAEEHACAPIHQLFWHRLAGERLKKFYSEQQVPLLQGEKSIPFETLLTYTWKINGVVQALTLGELIERAKVVLDPARAAKTIIGHGDAHFGNVFLEQLKDYLYFDPAFAGRHSPLLDIIKPLFHNIFAMWMYFPHEIARNLHLSVLVQDTTIIVNHDYMLTPVRQAILRTKEEHLLQPLIAELRSDDALPADWLAIIQLALMCCPLLTINLLDTTRVPTIVTWLGFVLAVVMGNTGIQSWKVGRDD